MDRLESNDLITVKEAFIAESKLRYELKLTAQLMKCEFGTLKRKFQNLISQKAKLAQRKQNLQNVIKIYENSPYRMDRIKSDSNKQLSTLALEFVQCRVRILFNNPAIFDESVNIAMEVDLMKIELIKRRSEAKEITVMLNSLNDAKSVAEGDCMENDSFFDFCSISNTDKSQIPPDTSNSYVKRGMKLPRKRSSHHSIDFTISKEEDSISKNLMNNLITSSSESINVLFKPETAQSVETEKIIAKDFFDDRKSFSQNGPNTSTPKSSMRIPISASSTKKASERIENDSVPSSSNLEVIDVPSIEITPTKQSYWIGKSLMKKSVPKPTIENQKRRLHLKIPIIKPASSHTNPKLSSEPERRFATLKSSIQQQYMKSTWSQGDQKIEQRDPTVNVDMEPPMMKIPRIAIENVISKAEVCQELGEIQNIEWPSINQSWSAVDDVNADHSLSTPNSIRNASERYIGGGGMSLANLTDDLDDYSLDMFGDAEDEENNPGNFQFNFR